MLNQRMGLNMFRKLIQLFVIEGRELKQELFFVFWSFCDKFITTISPDIYFAICKLT
jgi:hypothetical protein